MDNLLQAFIHKALPEIEVCREGVLRVCGALGQAGDGMLFYPQADCQPAFPEGCGGFCDPVIHMERSKGEK